MTEIKFKALWLLVPSLIIALFYFFICFKKYRQDMSPKQIAHSLFVGVTGGGCITALIGLYKTTKEIFWNNCCNNLSIEFMISPPILCLGLALLSGHKVYKEFHELINKESEEQAASNKVQNLKNEAVSN